MLPAICTAAFSAVHGCSELTVTLPQTGHAQQQTCSACVQCSTAHVDMGAEVGVHLVQTPGEQE